MFAVAAVNVIVDPIHKLVGGLEVIARVGVALTVTVDDIEEEHPVRVPVTV